VPEEFCSSQPALTLSSGGLRDGDDGEAATGDDHDDDAASRAECLDDSDDSEGSAEAYLSMWG
jgi:hypothetical protein